MDTSIKAIKTTAFLKEGLDKMKKWRPFATMPEQYLGLQEIINKQLEVPQPLLTEEQMEQINFTLIEALHTNKQVYLTYYKNGQLITETGLIQFVDSLGISLFLSMKYSN